MRRRGGARVQAQWRGLTSADGDADRGQGRGGTRVLARWRGRTGADGVTAMRGTAWPTPVLRASSVCAGAGWGILSVLSVRAEASEQRKL